MLVNRFVCFFFLPLFPSVTGHTRSSFFLLPQRKSTEGMEVEKVSTKSSPVRKQKNNKKRQPRRCYRGRRECCFPLAACPAVTSSLLDVVFQLANYEDQGLDNNSWAVDQLVIHLTAYQVPDGNLYARADIRGTWTAVAGAQSPQSTTTPFCVPPASCTAYIAKQLGNACGQVVAFEDFIFPRGTVIVPQPNFAQPGVPVPTVCCASRRGTRRKDGGLFLIDVHGTLADTLVPVGSQVSTVRIYQLISSFFSQPYGSLTFRFLYSLGDQLLWVDESNMVFGDVLIGPNGCPLPVSSNPMLEPPLMLSITKK